MRKGTIVNGYFFLGGVLLLLCGEPLLACWCWAMGAVVEL